MHDSKVDQLISDIKKMAQSIEEGEAISALQRGALKHCMEDLYTALSHKTQAPAPKPVVEDIPVERPVSSEVESINNEIEEVFSPQVQTTKKTVNFSVNERIMFTNELFNGDESGFTRCIDKLTSFPSKDKAVAYFDQMLKPVFEKRNCDEEVINEFAHFIAQRLK